MYSIGYSPSNSLHLSIQENHMADSMQVIYDDFASDWRAGWFRLAAEKPHVEDPALKYWQEQASHFLTALCHIPAGSDDISIAPPDAAQLSEWYLRAPPMVGGEYLSPEKLLELWNKLYQWCLEKIKEYSGVHEFLEAHAPNWQKVGRVCLHLAENKKDQERPFAFLATYSTGFGAGGRLKHLPLKEALNQYSGVNNRQALIRLLTPVHQASEKCPWVQDLLSSSEIYQPLAWTPQKAYQFLSSIPQLEESGLTVKIPNWWKQRPRPQVKVTIDSATKSSLGISSLLNFNVKLAVGDELLSEEELSQLLSANQNLVCMRGQWIEVDRERLQEALAHWKMVQKQHKEGLSFIDGMRLLAGAPSSIHAENPQSEYSEWVKITAGDHLAEILRHLRDPSMIPSKNIHAVKAELRPYQQDGVNWLSLLSGLGLGACLADDMGLGKTLQILSLLLFNSQQSADQKPSLLIVPASLLGNWEREASRFTPSLKLLLLHPSELKGEAWQPDSDDPPIHSFKEMDLVITTYSMVTRLKWLRKYEWKTVILDEAQAIKNPGTKQTIAVKALKTHSRIALTGTPIENRLSDLWSLFDFLNPGLLGSPKQFKDYIGTLQSHPSRFESLRKLTAPYILRRMKTDPKIISDLPAKIETSAYCYLTALQAQQYQAVVDNLSHSLKSLPPENRRAVVLKTLLELKQICNHPSHYSGTGDFNPAHSGKFDRLQEICEELAARQEKVLIFTQFKEIIEPLDDFLSNIFEKKGLILHGGTPINKRKELVEKFQNPEGPPFFILSLKAGGTGLTLTEASHVIHFDRWWNPAVEDQATDRAFRIGQKKNVQVHKFITQGTVEEKIDEIISSKKKLAHEILVSGEEIKITELSDADLMKLISLDIKAVTN